jgi:ABC-type metal ion transport system substrate-binding protein
MSINTIDDVIKTLDKINNHENLNEFFDYDYQDDFDINVINSNYIEDDDLKQDVDEIELSASHFFLDASGLVNRIAEAKLNKRNYKISKLSNEFEPMTHSLSCDKFMILFNNY